jgi:hypothetical protein
VGVGGVFINNPMKVGEKVKGTGQACPRFWGRAYIGIWILHYYITFSCMGLSKSIEKEKSRMGILAEFGDGLGGRECEWVVLGLARWWV